MLQLTDSQNALMDLLRVLRYSDPELTQDLDSLMHKHGIDDAFNNAIDQAVQTLPILAIQQLNESKN